MIFMDRILKSSDKKNKILSAVFVFIILIVRMLFIMPKNSSEMSDPWTPLFYVINYKTMGFVPRGLIGSICMLFTDYIAQRTIYIISVCMTVLLILIISLLIYRVISHLDFYESAAFLSVISVIAFASSDTFYLFDNRHFGITDIYFFMLTLLSVVLIKSRYLKWLFPIIMALCMAIYEGYFFAFGSVISIILLYWIFKAEKKSGYIAVTVISAVTVIAAFLYFYIFFRADFLGAVPFKSSSDAVSVLSTQTDVEFNHMFEELYFWESSFSVFSDGRWNILQVMRYASDVRAQCLHVFFLVYSVLLYLWISAFKKEKEKKNRIIYIFCALAPLGSIPLLAFSEQMKYITYMLWSQIILTAFFAIKEEAFSRQLKKIGKFIVSNPICVFVSWTVMILFRFI